MTDAAFYSKWKEKVVNVQWTINEKGMLCDKYQQSKQSNQGRIVSSVLCMGVKDSSGMESEDDIYIFELRGETVKQVRWAEQYKGKAAWNKMQGTDEAIDIIRSFPFESRQMNWKSANTLFCVGPRITQ